MPTHKRIGGGGGREKKKKNHTGKVLTPILPLLPPAFACVHFSDSSTSRGHVNVGCGGLIYIYTRRNDQWLFWPTDQTSHSQLVHCRKPLVNGSLHNHTKLEHVNGSLHNHTKLEHVNGSLHNHTKLEHVNGSLHNHTKLEHVNGSLHNHTKLEHV